MKCFPPFQASSSMLYPGDGSLESQITRANRSRQFPIAISIVSPKILYLPLENEIICLFPLIHTEQMDLLLV